MTTSKFDDSDGRYEDTSTHFYDGYGRLQATLHQHGGYPDVLYAHGYNAQGQLAQLAAFDSLLWQVNDRDGLGRVSDESLGTDNALATKRTFWSNSGRLKTVQSGTAALPTSLQNDSYGWDDMATSPAARDNGRTTRW